MRQKWGILMGLCCLFSSHLVAQMPRFKAGDVVFVWAQSGLNIRATAQATGAKVGTVAYGAPLTVLSVTQTPFSVSEKAGFTVTGHWLRVKSGTTEGFVFDGYLSHLKAPDRQRDGDIENYLMLHVGEKGGKIDLTVHEAGTEKTYTAADTTQIKDGDAWYKYTQLYRNNSRYTYEIVESGGHYTWEWPQCTWFEAYTVIRTFFHEEGQDFGNLNAQKFDKKTQVLSLEPLEGGAGCYFTIKIHPKNKTLFIIDGYCGC